MSPSDPQDPSQRAEEFLQIFHKGAEFTQELLKENERLRYRLLEIEKEATSGDREDTLAKHLRPLQARIDLLENEKREFERRLRDVEEENLSFATRYVEIEAENNMLANLYIASFQLHATLEFSEVVRTISEIIINLVGAEAFAVYLLEEKSGALSPISAEGLDLENLPVVPLGEGFLGKAVQRQDLYLEKDVPSYTLNLERPMVVIPLCLGDRPVGGIAVYGLLAQKENFSKVDFELFRLLGGHAATALSAARLHTLSARKLSTMQGFIDLLTQK